MRIGDQVQAKIQRPGHTRYADTGRIIKTWGEYVCIEFVHLTELMYPRELQPRGPVDAPYWQ